MQRAKRRLGHGFTRQQSETFLQAPRSRGARLQGTAGAKKPGPVASVAKPKQAGEANARSVSSASRLREESQKFPLAAAGAAALAAACALRPFSRCFVVSARCGVLLDVAGIEFLISP